MASDHNLVAFTKKLLKKAEEAPAGEEIIYESLCAAERLIEKNISYGNSAIEPVRIFSKAATDEAIRVRIDDKLSRLIKGTEFIGDNDEDDLLGYLILLKVCNGPS